MRREFEANGILVAEEFLPSLEKETVSLRGDLLNRLGEVIETFPEQLKGGFQATVELALKHDAGGYFPECDAPFKKTDLTTVMHWHFRYGEHGSFALAKLHTLRRIQGLAATGNFTEGGVDLNNLRNTVIAFGNPSGTDKFLSYMDGQKDRLKTVGLVRFDHEMLRNLCDLSFFPGAIRIPFTINLEHGIGGEIRISFSGLTAEQDLMSCFLIFDCIEYIKDSFSHFMDEGRIVPISDWRGEIKSTSDDTREVCVFDYTKIKQDKLAGYYFSLWHSVLASYLKG